MERERMIDIKDLNKYESKYAIIIDGERWMIKFPESTKDFMGRQKKNAHFPSYTASPLSEYWFSDLPIIRYSCA